MIRDKVLLTAAFTIMDFIKVRKQTFTQGWSNNAVRDSCYP
ncbi:MAG: hypothetical protein ABI172_00220 [Ginsengibacter sp.]